MRWNATTDHEAVGPGTAIRVDSGYSDVPPQEGHEVAIAHGNRGRVTRLTVVSSAADRLELTDGRRSFALTPHGTVTKAKILDEDGRYHDAWIVA